ncbi:YceI family protein [Pseudoduganella sp. UC29_106]|uniref:YceI family protein n=1 Tax=Pseudoduganella sp. UC29_106 TaxID=3374553 RepID=UPI003758437E
MLAIDHVKSVVAITVRRGGTLARLGHDHVIASHTLDGYVAAGMLKAVLRFKLSEMSVDEAPLRAQAGLPPPPSADAIFATRRNMLEHVLEAEKYPWLLVQAEQAPGNPALLNADITLHGETRRYSVPVTLERKDGTLRATGSFNVKQTDFGIKPFSVMGGAMVVQDQVELRFDISAR